MRTWETVAALLTWGGLAFVVYVWAGYPLFLRLACLLRRNGSGVASEGVDEEAPSLTVVIAAYNEADWIRTKVENTFALDYPTGQWDVIVVTDGSDDGTPELARSASESLLATRPGPRLQVLHRPERQGKTAAVVRAVARSRGEIVVLTDANTLLSPNALRALVRPFSSERVAVVSGAKTIAQGDGDVAVAEGAYWRYEGRLKEHESCVATTVSVVGEIMAFRREVFEPPPPGVVNDDFWIAMTALSRGFDVKYAPDAISLERVAPTAGDELDRRARIVSGRYQAMSLASRLFPRRPLVLWMLASHKLSRPLVPFAMAAALVGNLAWSAASVTGRAMLALQLSGYLLAALGGREALGGPLGSLSKVARHFVAANLAAVRGLGWYWAGRPGHVWRRVERRKPL